MSIPAARAAATRGRMRNASFSERTGSAPSSHTSTSTCAGCCVVVVVAFQLQWCTHTTSQARDMKREPRDVMCVQVIHKYHQERTRTPPLSPSMHPTRAACRLSITRHEYVNTQRLSRGTHARHHSCTHQGSPQWHHHHCLIDPTVVALCDKRSIRGLCQLVPSNRHVRTGRWRT
jgi:hypothetical protein